eukprot:CAMPEP_0114158832 /NCGR_PEP_ID=MMETSP0043_2-20121206/27443_1 /TAXON_ID=464988 /ORGANISM="Hemiselmis andersenii, Strain CCMP644" /LENGTH=83 /DNA_ID=CAMNT_0001254649 /DNA_START=51 /DNA_END=302 /DNA_ORIENTATION=-
MSHCGWSAVPKTQVGTPLCLEVQRMSAQVEPAKGSFWYAAGEGTRDASISAYVGRNRLLVRASTRVVLPCGQDALGFATHRGV